MMESVNNNIYCYNGGNKHKLYMLLRGGIGNRIFQVLSAYGFAEKWNMDLHFINSSENHINMNSSKEELKVLFNNITKSHNFKVIPSDNILPANNINPCLLFSFASISYLFISSLI